MACFLVDFLRPPPSSAMTGPGPRNINAERINAPMTPRTFVRPRSMSTDDAASARAIFRGESRTIALRLPGRMPPTYNALPPASRCGPLSRRRLPRDSEATAHAVGDREVIACSPPLRRARENRMWRGRDDVSLLVPRSAQIPLDCDMATGGSETQLVQGGRDFGSWSRSGITSTNFISKPGSTHERTAG